MPTFAERLAAIRGNAEPSAFESKLTALRGGPSVADEARARLEARGITPGSQVPETDHGPGFLRGVVDQLVPSREALSEIGSMLNLRGPVEQAKTVYGAGKNVLSAHADQVVKAKDSYLSGDIVEGMGHAAAAAMPVIGPAAAAAGEEIEAGNIEYGLGRGAGLIADVLLPGAGGRRASALQESAPTRILRAEEDYARTFGNSAKSRSIAERTVPQMMDRGMTFSDPKMLAANADEAATAINIDGLIQPGQTLQSQDILGAIDDLKAEQFSIINGNQVPKAPESFAISKALDDYAEIIRGHSTHGSIDAAKALELRRLWEDRVGKFYESPSLSTPGSAEARMGAADSLRDPLNRLPGIGEANAEKSFQINVQKLGEAAPQSKTVGKVLGESGAIMGAGALVHTIPGVGPLVGGLTMGGAAIKALREIPKTPAWRTASAIHRRNFAKALQAGDYTTAGQIAGGLASGALIADEYGYPDAVGSLKQEIAAAGSPEMGRQVVARKSAVYRGASGDEIPIPRGIMAAFTNQHDRPDNALAFWLTAMGKQGKIRPGGQLVFIDQ
jgi:hypothetical protein